MKHLDIVISGRVQGVFFRATSKADADQLGVKVPHEMPLMERYLLKLKAMNFRSIYSWNFVIKDQIAPLLKKW